MKPYFTRHTSTQGSNQLILTPCCRALLNFAERSQESNREPFCMPALTCSYPGQRDGENNARSKFTNHRENEITLENAPAQTWIFHLIKTLQPTTAEQLEHKIEIGIWRVQALSKNTLILHISFNVYLKVCRLSVHSYPREVDWTRRLAPQTQWIRTDWRQMRREVCQLSFDYKRRKQSLQRDEALVIIMEKTRGSRGTEARQ